MRKQSIISFRKDLEKMPLSDLKDEELRKELILLRVLIEDIYQVLKVPKGYGLFYNKLKDMRQRGISQDKR